jgi:hypothetical protein
MFEGTRETGPESRHHLLERRFAALAAAVREHEARARGQLRGMRPHDAALYRRLRQILSAQTAAVPTAIETAAGMAPARAPVAERESA